MDNTETLATLAHKTQNRKLKRCATRKNRGWNQLLAKVKQLLLTRHP
jgi:hypothetical protein